MLGVTALAEQVTKITEWINSQAGARPSGSPPTSSGNQMMDFIKPLIANLDIGKIIEGLTGGGGGSNPFADVDKELVADVMKAARDKAVMEREALRALRDEIVAGKQVFRNKETGDIMIANPAAGKAKESS